jgi:cytoskeletal protein CcmA (bactofilin family)
MRPLGGGMLPQRDPPGHFCRHGAGLLPEAGRLRGRSIRETSMNMGQSISINGELNGAEDLTLEGHVKGKISLPDNVLTVGTNARIDAEVIAKTVVVLGQVVGNVTVKEKFELKAGGSMQGNLNAPRIAMADGATFSGKIEMPQLKASGLRPVEKPAAIAV